MGDGADETQTFEALYAQLEDKARLLETGNLPLEASLKLYEEGAALVDRLQAVLAAAELRIRTVQNRSDDTGGLVEDVGDTFDDDGGEWEDET